MVKYILAKQNKDGGWPLFFDGESDISASVKAYYALKLSGESENLKHMIRAKSFILKGGGIEKANVFTKISLALLVKSPGIHYLLCQLKLLNFRIGFLSIYIRYLTGLELY